MWVLILITSMRQFWLNMYNICLMQNQEKCPEISIYSVFKQYITCRLGCTGLLELSEKIHYVSLQEKKIKMNPCLQEAVQNLMVVKRLHTLTVSTGDQ